jgi:glycosyltransferase involved in cell wall biosynthesis
MKPRIIYWNNIPAPYVVEWFNALERRGNLDFEAWFSSRTEPGRSWIVDESQWEFRYRYLSSIGFAERRFAIPPFLARRDLPDLVVSLYAGPSFLLGWLIARTRGVRVGFWVEATFDAWVRRRWWKDFLKRVVFRRASVIITPGRQGRAFARRYGAVDARIYYARHRVDVTHFASASERAREDRSQYRAEMGLVGTTFVYVGRLWAGKGLGYLLDAFGALQRRTPEQVSLLLVGDGPEEAKLRARCSGEHITNVFFVGFRHKGELPKYFAVSDVFVFPTLGDPYGLVVDEAMACSLPVISTTSAGEIGERVEEGVNGFRVPPRDAKALLDRMEVLATDASMRIRMGKASGDRMVGQSPDRWAEDFEHAVLSTLATPRVGRRR